ncbi:MAG TPA: BON domain-containing protein [Opitutaceae bacterium]|nr:BON domain-containing protein [Opitutaceae bacterium]
MKTNLLKQLSILSLAGGALALAGCAGSQTKESTGENIDDTAITAKVKAALFNDDLVKSHEISVTTFKGTVQLSGFVDNSDQKAAAERDAKAVPGVKDVQDNLTTK